ncbi:MAG TPA: glycosyltransferase family 2 protein [Spirochaetota bacterium]|nr:glycosyltransferase family 2 protein [Spirochaetota bacterium]
MKISIIIPTLNRTEDLKKTLNSIKEQSYSPYEIIIPDQSDDDCTKALIETVSQDTYKIKYFSLDFKSLTKARNFGIKNITPDTNLVIFLDDDVILEKNYLENVNNFFESDTSKEYYGGSGYIKNVERKSKIGFLYSLFGLQEYKDGKFKISGLPTFPKYSAVPYPIEFISGCNMIYRKKVFDDFSFDEVMIKYCYMEDVDFSYRVSRKYKLIFLPEAQLIHNVSQVNRLKIRENRSFFIQNYLYLFNKNIKKNLGTVFVFLISITGMFFLSLIFFKFNAICGYFDGILRFITKKYTSLTREDIK